MMSDHNQPFSCLSLARALGLKPLDRVQVASRTCMAEFRNDCRVRGKGDLPYWYFQRLCPDGLLEVCSPGGSSYLVHPQDICDVIASVPIQVQAVPDEVFVKWLGRPASMRAQGFNDSDYEPAYLRRMSLDRWGGVDRTWVSFLDESLNRWGSTSQIVSRPDRERLRSKMLRSRMPVYKPKGHSNYSADRGVDSRDANVRHAAGAFIQAALAGHGQLVEALSRRDISPLSTASINRSLLAGSLRK